MREAIFSALQSRDAIRGARVVDLYAGTGALGLEAASRGASSVVLVERSATAVRICADNIAQVMRNAPATARPDITVAAQPVANFLEASTSAWDLVFIDPPYDIDEEELSRALGALAPRLAPGSLIVLERATKSREPQWPTGISLERSRNYGDTTLWWATAGE